MVVWRMLWLFMAGAALALLATLVFLLWPPTLPLMRVSGALLLNATNDQVILHGVDVSGTEYDCVQGHGIFVGPADQVSVTAMKNWGVNAVRLPLNEACWNGESYVNSRDSGRNYQRAIEGYVHLLNDNGISVILDLEWTDGRYTGNSSECSSAEALCLKPMPDAAQSVPFWTSVATVFKNNAEVLFDLFNEPFPDRALPTQAAAWQCWLHGGRYCSPGIGYPVAGVQTLVNTVRATGATNVVMVAGLAFANNLTQWLRYEPSDPDHNLAASWHSYNYNSCAALACWNAQVAPLTARVPVIAAEIGENDCSDRYITPLMNWLDQRSDSYLAWSWNTASSCAGNEKLISNESGTPTAYGTSVRAHLRALAAKYR